MSYDTRGPAVALTKCFFCQEGNEILLQSRNINVERLNGHVINMRPCSKCEGFMKQGVILITIDNSKSTPGWNKEQIPNPWRTGGWFVVKAEAVKRMFNGPAVEFALKNRWMFIEHEAAERVGLFEAAKTAPTDTKE